MWLAISALIFAHLLDSLQVSGNPNRSSSPCHFQSIQLLFLLILLPCLSSLFCRSINTQMFHGYPSLTAHCIIALWIGTRAQTHTKADLIRNLLHYYMWFSSLNSWTTQPGILLYNTRTMRIPDLLTINRAKSTGCGKWRAIINWNGYNTHSTLWIENAHPIWLQFVLLSY